MTLILRFIPTVQQLQYAVLAYFVIGLIALALIGVSLGVEWIIDRFDSSEDDAERVEQLRAAAGRRAS